MSIANGDWHILTRMTRILSLVYLSGPARAAASCRIIFRLYLSVLVANFLAVCRYQLEASCVQETPNLKVPVPLQLADFGRSSNDLCDLNLHASVTSLRLANLA